MLAYNELYSGPNTFRIAYVRSDSSMLCPHACNSSLIVCMICM